MRHFCSILPPVAGFGAGIRTVARLAGGRRSELWSNRPVRFLLAATVSNRDHFADHIRVIGNTTEEMICLIVEQRRAPDRARSARRPILRAGGFVRRGSRLHRQ
jgi:hypothetical protein